MPPLDLSECLVVENGASRRVAEWPHEIQEQCMRVKDLPGRKIVEGYISFGEL
jgi:hypothetical protein